MRIFVIVLAVFLMLALLVGMAVALARAQRRVAVEDDAEADWEIIEPAQLDDGTPVSAEVSRRQKARQVLSGQVYHDTRQQARIGMRLGLVVLVAILLLAVLVLVPAAIVMFGQ